MEAADPFKVAKQLHQEHPDWNALQVGTRVLAASPQVPGDEMLGILGYAGFDGDSAHQAVEHLYGSAKEFVVQAGPKWQDTGVVIDLDHSAAVNYVSGMWTANPANGNVDAAGNPSYVAKPGYTLPGVPEGALIGIVGKHGANQGEVESQYQPFVIGRGATVPSGQTGSLFLCINDDLHQEYGAGFEDNSGELMVRITESKAAS